MQLLRVVIDFRQHLHIINDTVVTDKVDTQGNLILGQDLLAGDVHLCQTSIHNTDINSDVILPEVVCTRFQNRLKLLIEVQSSSLILGDLHFCVEGRGDQHENIRRNAGINNRCRHIDHLEVVLMLTSEESVLALAQSMYKLAIYEVEGHLLISDLDNGNLPCDLRGLQEGFQRAGIRCQLPLRTQQFSMAIPKQVIFASFQQFNKLAILREQTLLIFFDDNLLHICNPPQR